jgi:undecaprenyl phosphate N,N'-diacetylbacillosamine 1-phosphate transferase
MRIAVGRVISSLICLLGLPIHLLLIVLIRLCDPGPGLYRSSRLGKDGVPFTLLKYRTMKLNAPSIVTTQFKAIVAESDPRVTRLGKWLRSGIDELPQFWNIVRGEMEWVGPRPDEAWMLPNYGPVSKRRLECLPGITGLAQVLNSRNLSTAESYAIDLWYLEHRGFWLDAWIVFMTPLFMTGWVSIGGGILQNLRSSPEFNSLHEACEAELSAAASASPVSSKTLLEDVTK